MRLDRSEQEFIRRLVYHSRDERGVPAEGRVREILEALRQQRPRGLKGLLKAYRHALARAVRMATARIEYAGEPEATSIDALVRAFEAKLDHGLDRELAENRDLIAGVRLSVGDDVYDYSLRARLHSLSQQIAQ